MASYEATNEDFCHLDDGLPAEILRLRDAGDLTRAVRLIEAELDAGTRPELAACMRAERARMLRVPLDYCVTRERAIGQIRAEWSDFGEADLDRLVDHGRIDWRFVEVPGGGHGPRLPRPGPHRTACRDRRDARCRLGGASRPHSRDHRRVRRRRHRRGRPCALLAASARRMPPDL